MLDLALHMMKFPQPKSVTASAYCKIAKRNGVGLMGGWDPEKYSVEDSAFGCEVSQRSFTDPEDFLCAKHERSFNHESSNFR